MYRILAVDDEENIRKIIKKYAEFEGHTVDEAATGMAAVEKCLQHQYDIVIMDIMMPDLDGFSASKEIRRESNVPIIMLSARSEEYDKIHGFELGIDDYVVKPFSPRELMMRISAVVKRSSISALTHEIYEYEGLSIDFTARVVHIDGSRIELSPKEYGLLIFFVHNRGIALTRERILSKVWGYDFFGDDRTLDTHIKLLRKKLDSYGNCVVTVRGVGYRFEEKRN